MLAATLNDAADVFISYSSQDARQVVRVADALSAAGVSLWRDGDRLLGGDSYNARIVEAIKRSKVLVLACSPHALASDNVHQELMVTWDAAHRCILPLWLSPPLTAREIPDRFTFCLAGRQHIPVLDRPACEWLPPVLLALARFGVHPAALPASASVSVGPASAWERLRSFAGKFGKPAGFVAKLALQTFVPGAPLLAELAEQVFDVGANLSNAGQTPALAGGASSSDVEKLAQYLGVLQADLGGILERVAALHGQPDRARKLLSLAHATDANARAAIVKLDALAGRFDRVEHQNDRILQGQEELLSLVRDVAAGRPAAPPPAIPHVAARVEAVPPAALPMIDSREVARREQRRWLERLSCEPAWTNDLGMRFRLIPPGRFRMGASDGDPHAAADERPGQTLAVPAPLYVATLPLTVAIVRQFLQEASSDDGKEVAAMLRDKAFAYGCRRGASADDVPAVEISARDAVALCGWMSRRDRRRYRLPTEAEWEYFARAGATGLYWWEEGVPAITRAIFAAAAPAAADDRRANLWGLADAIGNVAQWTCSEYGPLERGFAGRTAGGSAATLTVRGGSWRNALEQIRLSRRQSMNATARKDWLGVRLVCELENA